MTSDASGESEGPVLPEGTRARLVAFASGVLGQVPERELPGRLRQFRNFAPRRRASLAAPALIVEVNGNPEFRTVVADAWSSRHPELAERVREAAAAGVTELGSDSDDLLVGAVLLRPDGWETLVETGVADAAEARAEDEVVELRRSAAELKARLERDERQHAQQVNRLKAELLEARRAQDRARRTAAEARSDADREARERATEVAAATQRADKEAERANTASRRAAQLEDKLRRAVEERDRARRGQRASRTEADLRMWLLLDTAERAVAGLRRELDVTPQERSPADLVADLQQGGAGSREATRRIESPELLEDMLRLPKAHLIVDGYNVSKTAYGEVALEDQRDRLIRSLGATRARTGAEVTCVFDGSEHRPGRQQRPRGVLVMFSRGGQDADSLIRELVRAEPTGRVVIVGSSDREVVEDARRQGCHTVPSPVLADLIERS